MRDSSTGAQRASARRIRSLLTGVLAALIVVTAMSALAPEARAASHKVVIVVGPVGSATSNYKDSARRLASQARSYGASVVEIYSPNATWSRVSSAAKGANVLIYLGHGNGWPSPYAPFSTTSKDGTRPQRERRQRELQHQVLRRVLHGAPRPRGARRRRAQPPVLRVRQQRVGRRQPTRTPRRSGSTTTATASCAAARRPSSRAGSPASASCSRACSGAPRR